MAAAALAVCMHAGLAARFQQGTPDWARVEAETLEHFQALLRFDTTDPPGNERPAAEYLKRILDAAGIPARIVAPESDPHRQSVIARLKGNGSARPLLLMGHTDTVNVDPAKWTHPPFGAVRDGDYIYGRGAVDDKDNVAAALMTMLLLKRLNVPLDRDVIFLAEAAEEGRADLGIRFVVDRHFEEIDAEFCLAEGGGVSRSGGRVRFASIQTLEKLPYNVQLVSRGPAGHGSVPLETNAVVRLSKAVAKIADWPSPVRLNETTSAYFRRLAEISEPEAAARYRALADPVRIQEIDAYFRTHEPRHAAMLRSTLSPNVVDAGYRINVIPSEARATVDLRILPGDDVPGFLDQIRKVIDDPSVEVSLGQRDVRPPGREARIDSLAFKAIEAMVRRHYDTVSLPTMSTGATDMAFTRARGIECYGVGPATDSEDAAKGFGAHSDQERILEAELHRFVRFFYDTVVEIAGR
jgi:acetylornithine deacetylase/succinyl-diaminopimelate desuccinylase-like protein